MSCPPSIDTVMAPLRARLAGSLLRAARLLPSEPGEAAGEFLRFASDLRRRIRWEEEVLFPAARLRAPLSRQYRIEAASLDHRLLLESLVELEDCLRKDRRGTAALLVERLGIYLRGHNFDEDRGIFADIDAQLSPDERRSVIERLPEFSDPAPA
jgi:hypothetical protein